MHGPRSAEPVVRLLAQNKPLILAEVASWRRLYDESLGREIEMAKRRDRWANAAEHIAIAKRVAWGTVEVRWHLERGERPDPDHCAGCGDPIGEGSALELADGAQVHIADGDACIIAYGRKWRGGDGCRPARGRARSARRHHAAMTEATAEEMVASIRESLSAPLEIPSSAARCDAQHTSGVPRCLAAAKPTHLLDEERGKI